MRAPALVLDFGGPVLVTPFELTGAAEARLGLPQGSLAWRGPFDPGADPDWQAVLAGTLSERGYWAARAEHFGALTGRPPDTRSLIAALYEGDPAGMIRAGAVALVEAARAAGLAVGVLTNDLRAFHSDAWIARLEILALVDVLVDGSVEGILKPDRRIYDLTATRLGVPVGDVVFLDDQPVNVAGAVAAGWTAIAVDVTAPEAAFAEAGRLLGIAERAGGGGRP